MGSRLTNLLLGALLAVSIFGFALHQHEAHRTQRMLSKLTEAVDRLATGRSTGPRLGPTGLALAERADDDRAANPDRSVSAGEGADETGDDASAAPVSGGAPAGPGDEAASPDEPNGSDGRAPGDNHGQAEATQGGSGEAPGGGATEEQGDERQGEVEQAGEGEGDVAGDGEGSGGGRTADAWAALEPLVSGVLTDLLAGRYEQVTERFTADLRGVLTAERLRAVVEPIRAARGGLSEITGHARPKTRLERGLEAFIVTASTERGEPLQFIVTVDRRGEGGPLIAGLMLK